MIGDAYFQLRAQIGTGLFSLLRLAADADTGEATQTTLQSAQDGLRAPFLFIALGAAGSGKSALLNTLFEREFCGACEPATTGQLAVFKHGEEARNVTLGPAVLECERPHGFLRDFTLLDAPGFDLPAGTLAEDLAPFLPRADLIFFVIPARGGGAEPWSFLPRLGREALKRMVFVVWQNDRASSEEGANGVKRLRQTMLRNLGQACPIFTVSAQDPGSREKLGRWIESEVIFAEARRARFREIGEVAKQAMREIADQPRRLAHARQREAEQIEHLRSELAEREEQSQRQVAGTLWVLVQSFDALRERGESLLSSLLTLRDVARGRSVWPENFVGEIEAQAHASFAAQLDGTLRAIESDLRDAAAEHFQACREVFKGHVPAEAPPFARGGAEDAVKGLDAPLSLPQMLTAATAETARTLRLPLLAALGTVAVVLGALPVRGWIVGNVALAVGTTAFVFLLTWLLRRQVIAQFGRHITANRMALLAVLEPPLRDAIEQYFAQFGPALEQRATELTANRQQQEPLLTRLRQIEQTFVRLEAEMQNPTRPATPPDDHGSA